MQITPETRVGPLLDAHPELEDPLVAFVPAFDKLKNPVLRRTVARFATLEHAARVGGVALPELLAEFAALPAPPNNQRLMLMLDAGLLFEEPTTPRAEDFTALRAIEHLARTAPRSHALPSVGAPS